MMVRGRGGGRGRVLKRGRKGGGERTGEEGGNGGAMGRGESRRITEDIGSVREDELSGWIRVGSVDIMLVLIEVFGFYCEVGV